MKRRMLAGAATAALALGMTCGVAQAKDDTIKIGYFNWTDNIFTSNVINYILEHKMDRDVDMTMANPAPVFQGVAQGDFDFHSDMWLPDTHADYFDKFGTEMLNVGPVYTGARLGWAVPSYVPKDKINSISDLKSDKIKEKLDGRIVGIGSGAGLTRLSKKTVKKYGLSDDGYKLIVSSASGMTSALAKAEKNEEWIVVTAWSPHWMFGRWDLRYLDDPKGTLGGKEHADIAVREGFYRDQPKIYEMLNRLTIPIDDVQNGLNDGENTSYEKAAKKYVENHEALVHYWVTGEMP